MDNADREFAAALAYAVVPWLIASVAAVFWWRGASGYWTVPRLARRPVPWTGWDVIAVFAIFLALEIGVGTAIFVLLPDEPPAAAPGAVPPGTAVHQLVRLLSDDPQWFVWAIGAFTAVLAAPLTEEFLFRVVLQGWLEARFAPSGGLTGAVRAAGPVLLTALLFAAVHINVESGEPADAPLRIAWMMAGHAAASLLTLLLGLAYLAWRSRAQPRDFGLAPGYVLDVVLGTATFIVLSLPVFALNLGLTVLLSEYKRFSPAPISLFFFALALGWLYARTHRMVPCIVLHMLLNACSIALLWLSVSVTPPS